MVSSIRRLTSWATPDEFQLVFSSLFASEGDVAAQRFAIERIKVWLSRGACPHEVESTASLLELLLRDDSSMSSVASSSVLPRPSQQELRLSYSMALIRFVNSLVDPLQTTYYARSIAALSAQIGLPLWFVELRHAATHEDLPALAVLRDATRQALDWLYTHYWLNALSPPTFRQLVPLEPLIAQLTSYKSLMKASLRDASTSSKNKADFSKLYRSIDAWVAEAEGEGRGRERAIEGLVEAFIIDGGLVPTAKKKRPSARAPELSPELVAIWSPILERIDDTYEGFEDALISRMIELLSDTTETVLDKSHAVTFSAWIFHFVVSESDPQIVEMVIKSCLLSPSPNTLALLDTLSKVDETLAKTIKPLISVLRNADSSLSSSIKDNDAITSLEEMKSRMKALEDALLNKTAVTPSISTATANQGGGSKWRRTSGWNAIAIGALPGGVVNLDFVN